MSSGIPHQAQALATGAKHAEQVQVADLTPGDVVLVAEIEDQAHVGLHRAMFNPVRTRENGTMVAVFTLLKPKSGTPYSDQTVILEPTDEAWRLIPTRP